MHHFCEAAEEEEICDYFMVSHIFNFKLYLQRSSHSLKTSTYSHSPLLSGQFDFHHKPLHEIFDECFTRNKNFYHFHHFVSVGIRLSVCSPTLTTWRIYLNFSLLCEECVGPRLTASQTNDLEYMFRLFLPPRDRFLSI